MRERRRARAQGCGALRERRQLPDRLDRWREPVPEKVAHSCRADVRGLDTHWLEWGRVGAPTVVLLHGWMDVAGSFRFFVDACQGDWHFIAPDWQGFGGTAWRRDGYWFYDYLADLDALLREVSPDTPVHLVGHSLGGNVAMLYAAVRGSRVRSVVSLDAFGLPDEPASLAPRKLAKWLDALADPPMLASYADLAAVADRLQRNNPRLSRERATLLAGEWAEVRADGRAYLRADPRHKLPFPTVYRMEEVYALWAEIAAPVLWVTAAESPIIQWVAPDGDGATEVRRRIARVPHAELATVADAGHMLHHDQPEAVARLVEDFLARQSSAGSS
ncbi:MAG: alpha/beta hydrolase [Proteobacteria bacterium]|nr:alpha/beta hydrolase [Pseudomonadota bacterium]